MPETGMRRKYTAAKVVADVGKSRFGIDTVLGLRLPPPGEKAIREHAASAVVRRRSSPAQSLSAGPVVGEPVQRPLVYNPVALRHATAAVERRELGERDLPPPLTPYLGRSALPATRTPGQRARRTRVLSGVGRMGPLGLGIDWQGLINQGFDLTRQVIGQRPGSFSTEQTYDPRTGQVLTTTSGRQPTTFGLPLQVSASGTQVQAGVGGGLMLVGGAALLLLLVMMGGRKR